MHQQNLGTEIPISIKTTAEMEEYTAFWSPLKKDNKKKDKRKHKPSMLSSSGSSSVYERQCN